MSPVHWPPGPGEEASTGMPLRDLVRQGFERILATNPVIDRQRLRHDFNFTKLEQIEICSMINDLPLSEEGKTQIIQMLSKDSNDPTLGEIFAACEKHQVPMEAKSD